jgi:two-component system NtrC family sensor kinase
MIQGPYSAEEETRLAALERYAILDTLPEQEYEDVTLMASYICGTPIALISLVDRERQWFKSTTGLPLRETSRESSFCAHTLKSREDAEPETLIVPDALEDERFADNPLVLGGPGIRFYAGAPLIAPGGLVLGTVCVIDTKPRVLAAEQIHALEALSRQVMARLELRVKLIEDEKRAVALRTAEKLAAVGRLASSVAHEINNPLQSMTNLLFMAETSDAESRVDYIRQAQEELGRVSHIVTQTLRFHRQSDSPAALRLGQVVESVLMLFRTRLKHAATRVEVRDTQTTELVCYGSDVRQVVANLAGNALDAINGMGGGRILIRIRDAADPATARPGVRLTVADSGVGMDAATRARLFEPFFSTKGARGTGLGLWVSLGILEKHGATMRVKSRQADLESGGDLSGTVFTIFFPLAAQDGCGEDSSSTDGVAEAGVAKKSPAIRVG